MSSSADAGPLAPGSLGRAAEVKRCLRLQAWVLCPGSSPLCLPSPRICSAAGPGDVAKDWNEGHGI
jgi:hypothetical protein